MLAEKALPEKTGVLAKLRASALKLRDNGILGKSAAAFQRKSTPLRGRGGARRASLAGNGRQRALAAVAKQDAERAHKRLKLEKQYRNDAENDLAAAEASNRAIRHGLAVALRGVAIALEQ